MPTLVKKQIKSRFVLPGERMLALEF